MIGTEIAPELRQAIDVIVRTELGRFGVRDVEVIESEDAGGDPVIQVLVHYNGPGSEPDPRVASEAITKLNDKLYELREPRFAYLRHMVPEAAPRSRRRSRAGSCSARHDGSRKPVSAGRDNRI